MPLKLSTTISTGDLDPNTSEYGWVKITKLTHSSVDQSFDLVCNYGNDDGFGAWVTGILPSRYFVISDTDYAAIVSQMGSDAIPTYKNAAQHLYNWLISQGLYIGEYVDTNQ